MAQSPIYAFPHGAPSGPLAAGAPEAGGPAAGGPAPPSGSQGTQSPIFAFPQGAPSGPLAAGAPEAGGPVVAVAPAISQDQENQIRDSLANDNSACADHVDFALHVGASVPPDERLEPLPPEAVAADPQLMGFKFLVVEDQIVIVDPRTYRIAALIPEADPDGGGGGPACSRG